MMAGKVVSERAYSRRGRQSPPRLCGGFRHPIEIARTGFAVHRLHRDFPSAFGSGFGIDFQRDELSGEVLEIGIYVLIRTRFLAIDGDQVVARFYFQSRLGQRRRVESFQFSPG